MKYTDDMAQISGFGIDHPYELSCRKMVIAGVEWLTAHPTANPIFTTCDNIVGVINEDNDDAKALAKALLDAVPDPTGAMMQYSIWHAIHAAKLGWPQYQEDSRKVQKEREFRALQKGTVN